MPQRPVQSRSSTGVYGVAGHGIGYSLSPHIFRTVFNALRWRADYTLFDIEKSELRPLLAAMRTAPIRGLNVTKPYKEYIIPMLDRLDESAAVVGAVNTVVREGRRLVGYNTDMAGIIVALNPSRRRLRGKEALIFGAGGGARAVAYTLLKHFGMRGVTIAARNRARSRRLIHDLQDRMPPASLASAAFQPAADLSEALARATLVVNATPLGATPSKCASPLPKGTRLRRETIAFDLVYRPRPTSFSLDARRAGCGATIDGWPMLVAQAEAAFRLWTGRGFPPAVRRDLMKARKLP